MKIHNMNIDDSDLDRYNRVVKKLNSLPEALLLCISTARDREEVIEDYRKPHAGDLFISSYAPYETMKALEGVCFPSKNFIIRKKSFKRRRLFSGEV